MNAISELKKFRTKIDRELERFLNRKLRESEKIDPSARRMVKIIKDFVLRAGKRLRPAFIYFAYKACGGKDEEAVIYTAQVSEFLHTMGIIHDDIIDQSEKRRGKTAIHKSLGINTAILAGDLCFAFADEIFTHSTFEEKIIRKARRIYDLSMQEAIFGQYLDVLAPEEKKIDEEKIMKILEYKSGKYTIERPLHLGAVLADAPQEASEVFSCYGIPLGIAFQIQDDILGMFGKEKKIGKSTDSDLKEGKKTLLVIKALEKLKGEEKKKFLRLLGNKNCRLEDLEWIRKMIRKTGALDYSRELAKNLIKKANKALKNYSFQKEGKQYLLGIADYMLARKY